MEDKTAKIVRFHAVGGPEVLKIEQVPIPEPGKDEVRLKVNAIGLNRAEVMFRSGQYLETATLPSKLGYEAAGVVAAVGPDVDKSWLGKKASTVPAFLMTHYGVYGEVAIVPAYALAEFGKDADAAFPYLLNHLADTNKFVRASVIDALGKIHSAPKDAVPLLIKALDDRENSVQSRAAIALGAFGNEARAAVPFFLSRLTSENTLTRIDAASALGNIGTDAELTVPALMRALADTNMWVRASAAEALGKFGTNAKPAIELLIKMRAMGNRRENEPAARSLRQIDPERFGKGTNDGAVKLGQVLK